MPWDLGHHENDPPVWHNHPLNKYRRRRVDGPLPGVIKRHQWWAEAPKRTERINNRAPFFLGWPPAQYANHIHFTHTKSPECVGWDECVEPMRDLQKLHMDEGEPDIRHSFMITKDGLIIEGRGWDTMVPVPEPFTTFYTASLQIALIGDYSKSKPNKTMVKTIKRLVEWGIVNKKVYCCYNKTYDYELFNQYFGKCTDGSVMA